MMIGQGPGWVTAPVDRSYSGVRQIREIRFNPVEAEMARKNCVALSRQAMGGQHTSERSIRLSSR